MRIDGDSFDDAVGVAQYYICRFSCNSRQAQNFFHSFWQYSPKFFSNHLRGRDNVSCFRVIKSCLINLFLKSFNIRVREIANCFIFFEKFFSHLVHLFICALGGQNHRRQKLHIIFIFQSYFRVRTQFP